MFSLLVYYFAVSDINPVAIIVLTNAYTNNKYIFVIYVHLKRHCREFMYGKLARVILSV